MRTRRAWKFALLTSFVIALFAADATGTWSAQIPSRRRNTQDPRPPAEQGRGGGAPAAAPTVATFVLKVEGKKLTGTAEMPAFGRGAPEKVEIEDGKVDGDSISFTVGGSSGRENFLKGKVSGDTIEFSMTSSMDDYGTPPITFSAKRAQ
jgi:hypothetical protein